MKRKRIIVKGTGIYHVFNRTAYARYTLTESERDAFIAMMRKQAAFCGIEVLSYCVLSNHYHMLVRVPKSRPILDAELLTRYRCLYQDDPAPRVAMRPSDLEKLLAVNDEKAVLVRKRLNERMHCLSVFMKELQQRFGIWYNMTHGNKGTLWSERYRSVLVENNPGIMMVVAAYIELNPVRAGIVKHPESFQWCSLSAALNGDSGAQMGIQAITGIKGHHDALQAYTDHIYRSGNIPRRTDPSATLKANEQPNDDRGSIASLRDRITELTYSAVLGTARFIDDFRDNCAELFGLRPRKTAQPYHVLNPSQFGHEDLCSFRPRGRTPRS